MADSIVSYFDQLDSLAEIHDVDLLDAFDVAGVPDSTFYRSRLGADMKSVTARKVADAIATIGRRRTKGGKAKAVDAGSIRG